MADDGIKISISPSAGGAGTGGRRLAESPSTSAPSFVSDKFSGGGGTQRFPAPGTSSRSEIGVERELVSSQRALTAEIKQLRRAMQGTASGSPERATLQARVSDLLQQQKSNMAGAGTVAREAKALTTSSGAAIMPSARVLARSLIGVGQQTLQGNPGGAWQHAAQAFNAGRSLIGGGAAAEGAAAESAEAAGGLGVGTMLAAVGVAGAAGLAYSAWEHPGGIATGILGAPLTIEQAHKFGPGEEPRQAAAYRAARLLGDISGMGMVNATSGSRWSNLGIDPSEATQTVAAMREVGGSKYVSNAQAFKGAQLGAYLGFTPEQTAQVGGAAGRLGVSPESAIRTIASGVERGNQQGRQFEVASASLDFLKQIATSAAVSGTAGLTAITNLSAILAKSGIAGFQGAQGISAISGIESAHRADDIFGTAAAGQGFVQLGEASILEQVNADKRFASRTPRGRLALSEQIRQAGFSGPYASIYGKAIHSEISIAESALGREYGLTAFEEANNMPVGGYRDASGKWISVNDSVTAMDQAFQSGDFLKASKIQSDLLTHGAGNISPMESASAGLAGERAATGEATSRTYVAGEKLEAAGIAFLRRHVTDKSTASALDYLSSTLGPSKPTPATKAGAPGLAYVPEPPLPPSGLPTPMMTPDALPTPGAPSYAASAAGAPIAGPGALSGLGDSVSGGVMLIAGLLERLIAVIQGGSGGAPGTPAIPAAPASLAPAHDHGPTGPTASTPKAPRH